MMEEAGIQTLIVTDICRDGMLSGPSYELYRKLSKLTTCDLIASGGIASLEDLEQLEKEGNVVGAITGKAIYSGAIDLKPALMMLNKAKGK